MARPKDKRRTAEEINSARRVLAANKPKRSKGKRTKRGKKAKKRQGPTAFQKFLMRDPAAAKRKMGW